MNHATKVKTGQYGLLCALILLFVGGLFIATAGPGKANSIGQTVQEGEQLFQNNCAACHSIGAGDLIGPDLQDITQLRDRDWLLQFITQPDKVLASNDPIAQELLQKYKIPMPNLGITDAQAQSLLAYLEGPGPDSGVTAVVLTGGQSQAGEALFSGRVAFINGGTPCMACHSTAGLNAIGGGTLGPDLTHVYGRMGDAGLSAALVGLPFPSMQGIFTNYPLTTQEQADLFAYFQETDQQPAQTSALDSNIVWGVGAAGAIFLFGGMLVFWPRQRESISARLRKTR
jgi:cytochrome c2